MPLNYGKKIRSQLDQNLATFKAAPPRPLGGWIRSIRESLGMTGRQFAMRMDVEPSRVTALEKNEVSGNLTLRSLRRAAEALDCELVYALVPKTTLEDAVRRQAFMVAAESMQRVSHSMRLEDQGLSVKDEGELLRERAEELMHTHPRRVWEKLEPEAYRGDHGF